MTAARMFRGYRCPAAVILWAVRWYLQFPLSYRDLERTLADRGVSVDHTTMCTAGSSASPLRSLPSTGMVASAEVVEIRRP